MKYVTVRDYLRGLISTGLGVGSPIPSERDLCERFGVSRMTVRQAVDALVVEGVLERVQGRGTFVAQPKVDLQLRLTSFEDEMRRRGKTPRTRILSARRTRPPTDVAAALERATTEDAFHLHRIRLADGVPMAVEESWIPAGLVPDLFEPEPPADVYAALGERGLAPSWGEDTIEAIDVGATDAQLLETTTGAAGLRISRRTFSGDVAVDFSRSVYRGDRYALWVPVSAPRPALVPPRRRRGQVAVLPERRDGDVSPDLPGADSHLSAARGGSA